jgi:hypothetical protein
LLRRSRNAHRCRAADELVAASHGAWAAKAISVLILARADNIFLACLGLVWSPSSVKKQADMMSPAVGGDAAHLAGVLLFSMATMAMRPKL